MNSLSEITQLWDRALELLKERINEPQLFDTFFSNSYISSIDNNKITVVVNSSLGATIISNKFNEVIVDVIHELTESYFEIKYTCEELNKDEVTNVTLPPVKQSNYFKDAKLNTSLTFDNFVVGSFNREASQAAIFAASNPPSLYNPLFIYSNSGLGKTHLLHAIGNYILKDNPGFKILYINSNDFIDEYIKYVKADKDNESLKDFFKGVDVLLFDDIQFLEDKSKTQEFFFFVFEHLVNNNKRIVITADKQPNELKKIEDRLVTRFNKGLVVSINKPDQDTCVEILRKKIISNGLDLERFDDSVLYFYADKFSKDVRELEGALNRLMFYTTSMKNTDRITMDFAAEAVQSLVGGNTIAMQLNEQKIINVVADYYNLTPSQLTGKIRTGQIALARHIAMYLIRHTLDVSLKKIGEMFGGKDHTTVMNAISKVEKGCITDIELKQAITELKSRLK